MSDAIERIPTDVRWELATNGLTGAVVGYLNALTEAIGSEKYDEFAGVLWGEAGKQAKQLADDFSLPVEGPEDICEVLKTLSVASMGPEFAWEVTESTDTKCVCKTNKCAWHERAKEQGVEQDFCSVAHQKWGEGALKALGDKFTHRVTKNMQRGDEYCEYVIEKK